jgi:hypothetical protein
MKHELHGLVRDHRTDWQVAVVLIVHQRHDIALFVEFKDLMKVAVRVDVLDEIGVLNETPFSLIGSSRSRRYGPWDNRNQECYEHQNDGERAYRLVHTLSP